MRSDFETLGRSVKLRQSIASNAVWANDRSSDPPHQHNADRGPLEVVVTSTVTTSVTDGLACFRFNVFTA
ncbi:hypothetical protein EVAR_66745_1 [Eumeta japonica]|uniref:Uncharacterized protein n=1 Tax=Eumeta variegata TaxID=151549 RepID=A0A4C1Z7V7_EUMVA|nr:hypothetical protein EVAR_66745_1 [Eumeta japonica]